MGMDTGLAALQTQPAWSPKMIIHAKEAKTPSALLTPAAALQCCTLSPRHGETRKHALEKTTRGEEYEAVSSVSRGARDNRAVRLKR